MASDYVDYSRIDKVNIGHNVTEKFDFHDLVRTMLVRMLRRNYPNKEKNPIYTEFDPKKPNEDYPDIWMKQKSDIYVWELQSNINECWKKAIIEQYEDVNLTIVDLNKVHQRWIDRLANGGEPLSELRSILKEFVI